MDRSRARQAGWLLAAGMVSSAIAIAGDTPAPAAVTAAPAIVQGTAHQALFGVSFDGEQGLAVGAMGEMLESSDSGKSWKAVEQRLTPLALLGASIHGTHRIAVGQQGTILRREGDEAWQTVTSGTDARLLSVAVNAQGRAVAVGSFGTVLISDDAGKTWNAAKYDWAQFLADPVDPHFYDVIVNDSGVITIVGEYGLILRSTDGGKKWTSQNRGEIASLFDIELRADGVGFAVGQNGAALSTRDGGTSWKPMKTTATAPLLSVWSSADGRIVIAGMREMIESSDGGATWKTRTDQDFATAWYSGMASPASGGLIVVGHSGRIVRLGS